MAQFATTSPHLTVLDLSGCSNLTDACLLSLSKCLPDLKTLLLNYCWAITDNGIEHLCSGCTKIEILNLEECFKLSDKSLPKIGTLHRLKRLTLVGCVFTREALELLKVELPVCKIEE